MSTKDFGGVQRRCTRRAVCTCLLCCRIVSKKCCFTPVSSMSAADSETRDRDDDKSTRTGTLRHPSACSQAFNERRASQRLHDHDLPPSVTVSSNALTEAKCRCQVGLPRQADWRQMSLYGRAHLTGSHVVNHTS